MHLIIPLKIVFPQAGQWVRFFRLFRMRRKNPTAVRTRATMTATISVQDKATSFGLLGAAGKGGFPRWDG
jgi:hypothetical protein